MRKLLFFLFATIICAQIVSAQTKPVFKAWRLDIGLGIVKQQSGISGGLIYWEPSYTFFNKWTVGMRIEGSFQEMKNIGSYQGTLDYNYIIPGSSVRLFGGGGLGAYSVSPAGGCSGGALTSSTVRSTGSFGGMLRTGIRAGHWSLTALYNFVPTTHVYDMDDTDKVLASKDYQNNYWGFTLGIGIGGGRKK